MTGVQFEKNTTLVMLWRSFNEETKLNLKHLQLIKNVQTEYREAKYEQGRLVIQSWNLALCSSAEHRTGRVFAINVHSWNVEYFN